MIWAFRRSWTAAALLALSVPHLYAQDRAAPNPQIQGLTNNWVALASTLEQRLARLLPCDPRIRTSIEEANHASDLRFAALTSYWKGIQQQARVQLEAVQNAVSAQKELANEIKTDQAEAQQEAEAVAGQATNLRESAKRKPALAGAQRSLESLRQSNQELADRAMHRETSAEQLATELNQMLASTQARAAAIDSVLKTTADEDNRWDAYYAARLARAQTECSIVNAPAAAKPASDKRPSGQGNAQ